MEETDGRRLRSVRTRTAVIEAFLALLRETRTVPTTQQVADRAGVSARWLFDRFVDFGGLATATFDHIVAQGLSTPVGDAATRDRAARIDFQVRVRAAHCEKWLPLWRILVGLQARGVPGLSARTELVRDMTRKRLELMYAPELAMLEPAQCRNLLIVLEALMAFESWGCLRERDGLSVEEGCALWRETIDRLLPRAATSDPAATHQRIKPAA